MRKVRWFGGGLSLAALLGLVNAACLSYRPQLQVLPEGVEAIPLAQRWSASVGRGASGAVALRDSTIYVGDADRRVYAIDLTTGAERWSKRLPGSVFGGVVRSGDTLFAVTDRPNSRVVALSIVDGEQLWERDVGKPSAPITLENGRILVATHRGRLFGLESSTGTVAWERRVGHARTTAVRIGPDTVVIATTDSIMSLTAREGQVLKRIGSPGAIVGGWARSGTLLVAGTTDSLLVGLTSSELETAWSLKLDAAILERPAVYGDTAYVVSRSGTLYRVVLGPDPRAMVIAALHWPVTAPPVRFRQWVLVGGADGVIRAIDDAGLEAWRLPVWQPVRMSPVVLSDGILAIGGRGDISRYQQE
ncbi:MAG: PQQ-binding-like beta-propeller repeat protein [Gemmatimonadales bacterium]|nr:PQQ-binding-like beta-propeller repeat protein [Gemmatimonadales bacterium]